MWNPRREFELTLEDLHWFLDLMDQHKVGTWLDGGWGVDALLGHQTRPHEDVDIVLEQRHLDTAVATLRKLGYEHVPRDDTRPWNFVLGDVAGHLVDFHVVVLTDDGGGIYGPPQEDDYPAGSLTGDGVIDGRPVRCVSPEAAVAFHTGYSVDEKDWADVRRLCESFNIPIPADYEGFGHH